MEEKTKDKSLKIASIGIKITCMIIVCVIVAVGINLVMMLTEFKGTLSKTTEDNLMSLGSAYSVALQEAFSDTSEISVETLETILSEASIKGVESSYAYVVDTKGIMKYHPTKEKIGAEVENTVVKDVVENIKNGNIPPNDVVTYDFKGDTKYAGYTILPTNNWILVVSADEKEIMKPMQAMKDKTFLISCIIVLAAMIIGFAFSLTLTAPITRLTKAIRKLADLDFRENPKVLHMNKRFDEIGQMSRAVSSMQKYIKGVVEDINLVSTSLSENANNLNEISNEVNQNSTDNSATSQELAASMEETSATTETIDNNIVDIEGNTESIHGMSSNSEQLAKEIMDRASSLKTKTNSASNKAKEIYATVKDKTDIAIEQSKGVEKINQLTGNIMSIAKQTSLLALNASIESARAGEAGKGFAVVAQEIGTLATQSSNTVTDITKIVDEVNTAVANMSNCLETTLEFLENTVLNDYSDFTDVSVQYDTDAHTVEDAMKEISSSIENLKDTTGAMATSISDINLTIGESAKGVNDIAEKTSDIVSLTSKTYTMVQESVSYADKLKKIVEEFTL